MPEATAPRRWAVVAAYAIPLCVLPSAIWRAQEAFRADTTGWYLILLTVVSLLLAMSTLILVVRRGERLPAKAVFAAAVTGATLLIALCTYFVLNRMFHFVGRVPQWIGSDEPRHPIPGWSILRYYVPLLAWGPLLLTVAADYRRRTFARPR